MFDIGPRIFFPDMTILGKKNEGLEVKQGKCLTISFAARINDCGKKYESYLFIVYEEIIEKVQKMKLKAGSKVHIWGRIQQYETNGKININFKVLDIGYSEAAGYVKSETMVSYLPMKPMAFFPDMTVLGEKGALLKVDAEKNQIKFAARVRRYGDNSIESYIFVAKDYLIRNVQEMQLTAGSKVNILSEITQYEENGKIKIAFEIFKIAFAETTGMKEKGEIPTVKKAQNLNAPFVMLDDTFEEFAQELPLGYAI